MTDDDRKIINRYPNYVKLAMAWLYLLATVRPRHPEWVIRKKP
jgi:hypothetical protein